MIEVINISKEFNENRVLKSVSTRFETGKTNLIIGQSGSGKTVLLKSIVGLHDVEQGSIMYDDVCYNKLSFNSKKKIREEVGMIFQGGALFDSLTVVQNVMFPLDLFTTKSEDEKLDIVHNCLKRVNLINADERYPSEISGGMVKRVAIARAIVMNPKYLFCDEPNSGLDPRTSIVIDNLISDITKEYNITTIVNTHDMNSVMEIGDTVNFIHKGERWWTGSKDDIMDSDNEELNDFVFASKLAQRARVRSKSKGKKDKDKKSHE